MLEFFRKYQRSFFFVVTAVLIISFVFFGTFSSFAPSVEKEDRQVGKTICGSKMMLSDVQNLSRFLSTDREDVMNAKNFASNFCNDGVIRYDFLKARLADLVVLQYFDELKDDLQVRLDKARRFRPYEHPAKGSICAKAVWQTLLPELNVELESLREEQELSPKVFSSLSKLYQLQSQLSPEVLRRILMYQHNQDPQLPIDRRLGSIDLSLMGFHSTSDWFGRNFVDLVSEFILNTADAAEQKGYKVSMDEAKGDLIHSFQVTMKKLSENNMAPQLSFHQHLQSIGFDEKSATKVWQKVLLFRKYFQEIGEAAFLDRLAYKDFANYANEVAVVQNYHWPLLLTSEQDLQALNLYIQTVCPKESGYLPQSFLSVEEVERKNPAFVQTTYRAQVAEVSKSEVGLKASLRQVLQWKNANRKELAKTFSLSESADMFTHLDPKLKVQIDAYARQRLVDENPSWIEEALEKAPRYEKTWTVIGSEEPKITKDQTFIRLENVEKVDEKHIALFQDVRQELSEMLQKTKGTSLKNPFVLASDDALAALKVDPLDPHWVQSGTDPIMDQFKLKRSEQTVSRASKESWMKEQAFMMLADVWSPIHVEEGEISFFYLQERKVSQDPILKQMSFGKEILAADAKAYVAERLLQTVKMSNAIVIPLQKGDES